MLLVIRIKRNVIICNKYKDGRKNNNNTKQVRKNHVYTDYVTSKIMRKEEKIVI